MHDSQVTGTEDGVTPSFVRGEVPPAFQRRVVEIGPGGQRAFEADEWADALVVVERGDLVLECRAGNRRSFPTGSMLCLAPLPLRSLHNPASAPVVLVAVTRRRAASEARTVRTGDVDLWVETRGDRAAPTLLLVGNTVHTWPDALCERLAVAHRVVRYDLRDTGRSTAVDPTAPAYTLRDLVSDAAALLDALGAETAHVAGFGVGGFVAQLLALDHPHRVDTLTLVGTRPVAPGPVDTDLPDHAPELMAVLTGLPEPDWTDRTCVLEHQGLIGRVCAGTAPYDEAAAREHAGRVFDHVTAAGRPDPAALHRASQSAAQFAALDARPRWRERLGGVTAPTLVVHGVDDPFFPVGNGEALARDIPGARLLALPGVGHELPERVHAQLAAAVRRRTGV